MDPGGEAPSFQDIILRLQSFWAKHGCAILQPWDKEVGAGTFHPATALHALGPRREWRCAYVQPSRRPADGRYGENPNRLQRYYQFQVLLKPAPPPEPRAEGAMGLYEASLEAVGLRRADHDLRYVEDDWESPTLGAAGLGWEVWCDMLEISQFTCFQQVGGFECDPPSVELTYGLERIAMAVQGAESIGDIRWGGGMTYGGLHRREEEEFSRYNFERAPVEALRRRFDEARAECAALLEGEAPLPLPAYERCLEASHLFNLLDAREAISVEQRGAMILEVRGMMRAICAEWMKTGEGANGA